MVAGRLITIEGSEGAGKTTQLAFLRDFLEQVGCSVLATREPGGTALGEAIRAVLLNPAHAGMALSAETLLMFAARAEHIERVIRPALAAGQWVLCDRFTDATYAYQGGGRSLSPEQIAQLEQWVQGDLRPDLTVLLDVPPTVGLERVRQRGAALDRFEQESLAFFERVRLAYQTRASLSPERYVVIDAAGAIEQVRAEIAIRVTAWLAK